MASQYDNLKGGSRVRLQRYKDKAARSLETIRKHHPEDSAFRINAERDGWRGERWVTPHGMGFNRPHVYFLARSTLHGSRVIHADTNYLDHLREPGDVSYRARNWYCDAHQCETITGKVAALPHGRFLAYIAWSDQDGITIDASVYDDVEDAARAADELARIVAEHEREYSERWQEARDADQDRDEAREELRSARAQAHGLIVCLRELPQTAQSRATVCTMLGEYRDTMREALTRITEKTERIAELDMTGDF